MTETEAAAAPAVRVIELVVPEPVHPAPVTDQIYFKEPVIAGTV